MADQMTVGMPGNEGAANAPPTAQPARVVDVIGLDLVRNRLAAVWITGTGFVFVVVVLQSLFHRFMDKTQDAWGWLLPAIMPTLMMIITVLGYTALSATASSTVVRRGFFRVAMVLSVMYLALVALTVLCGPFTSSDGAGMISNMQMSNLWLGPFQGLVASALGVLFVTKQSAAPGDAGTGG
jgi:hypothetical protein